MSKVVREVKNKFGSSLGKIIEDGKKFKAVDRLGRTVGYFDPRTDKTTDRLGRALANGDILSSLTMDSAK